MGAEEIFQGEERGGAKGKEAGGEGEGSGGKGEGSGGWGPPVHPHIYGYCIVMHKLLPFSKFMRFPTLFYNV